MNRELALTAVGLAAWLYPENASAQWAGSGPPSPQTIDLDESCGACATVNSTTYDALSAAANAWNGLGEGNMINWGSGRTIQFRDDIGAVPSGSCGVEMSGQGRMFCHTSIMSLSAADQTWIYTHEFGHVLGAYHDETYNDSIMWPYWDTRQGSGFSSYDLWLMSYNWNWGTGS